MAGINIPVGISDFEKIRRNGYYYVDKTGLIPELLKGEAAEVTLITRPRRFGKTLGMSMLASFFDIRKDSRDMFSGLSVMRDEKLCRTWMNQRPVLFLSLRKVDGLNFTAAYEMLVSVIAQLCKEHLYLLESHKVNEYDKEILKRLLAKKGTPEEMKNSLGLLTEMMQAHFGKPVILLMDEYDVPVAKANANGYYREMLDVMKGLMQVFKDNRSLQFAVVSGCLKIAKESIFTGTNNFVSDTITSTNLDEYFGFTEHDVAQILKKSGMEDYAREMREWYDGYCFGSVNVYCPWDVMNYLYDLLRDPKAKPVGYWKNTSDNAIIRSFIDYAGASITKKMETLLSGGVIRQKIEENLTYDYLHASEENLWSILYLTGYLTSAGESDGPAELPSGEAALVIPNEEIREIFATTIKGWFEDTARAWNRKKLFAAVWSGDCETITGEMNRLLRQTISYHDYKEDFYHAFLAGIFAGAGYEVESNREHGEGRSDIIIYAPADGKAAVFEAKYSKRPERMQEDCAAAVQQIDERMYASDLEDRCDEVFCYGISFYKKRCVIKKKE